MFLVISCIRVTMKRKSRKKVKELQTEITVGAEELNLYRDFWLSLTPRERLRRSMALRKRLRNPASIHDEKLFPKP